MKRHRGMRGRVRSDKEVLKQRKIGLLVAMFLLGASGILAQEPITRKTESPGAADSSLSAKQTTVPPKHVHRFWDKENNWLFAGVGAARTLDYFSTLNMRRRGRQEILLSNDAVDNYAAFTAIEIAATGASLGASYLFHRYGHHKLERWTSIMHIGLATTGGVRNYCLKTRHTRTAP